MSGSFAGKTVLITGAAAGIGRAIALAAVGAGARVVLGDIAAEAMARTADELASRGAAVVSRVCDVRELGQIEALIAAGAERFGHPDVVYANAGVEGTLCAPWDCTEADFTRVIDINLNGIWRTMKAVLPGMVARGSGAIVATASVAGLVGAGGLAAYVASKHGVVGLVKSVAISVAKSGVRVNALCPGMVETAMVDRLVAAEPSLRAALLALKPMGRLAQPEEIAETALWLGSAQASFVTGHALAVDGGYVAQ